ncbi:alpha/beta hydrolase [Nocardia camponoti]|uniref:Membrane protein n=1 Tax=Nocardia camponoti TaxID=1616106 RepID=A0A917V512_9NOCA|nr:alpha/beta-hydrolase family protein [Nocardia camponoti]GGK37525.1 membrane protein [Nocardia camponoti]
MSAETVASATPSRFARKLPGALSSGGLVGALVFVWLSLTPSLLPRGPLFQGVVTGATGALGYGVGVAVVAVAVWLVERPLRRPSNLTLIISSVVAVGISIAVLVWYSSWQRELRSLMGVAGLSWTAYPIIVVISLLIFALLIVGARAARTVARWVSRGLSRILPRRIAAVIAGILVIALTIALLNGVVAEVAMAGLNNIFKSVNDETSADTPQPTSPLRSGGPGSLMSWDSLGKQGRIFVSNGPTETELTAFNHRPAREPIRVYSGLDPETNLQAEAVRAVAELRRTGGFDRAVLAVASTTGTGWVNESTAAGIEYIANGDSAIVGMQYSFLPSWLSFLVDQERARQAGQALFEAVHAEWDALPANHRPKLVLFGESLGSFGGEAAFSSIADMAARTDGVLFVGPTSNNPVWRDVTARRDPRSPEILPIYRDGRTVRFAADAPDLGRPATAWDRPRVVYLQHASDPITWWTPQLLFQKPDWLAEPRGDDVLSSTRWIPVITFLQVSADMAVSIDVPDGHGHVFRADIANAWAAILDLPGWTPADTERLRSVLSGDN